MSIEHLLHVPAAAKALGVKDSRTVVRLCERHAIPIVQISRCVRALKESDYALLLAKMTDGASDA